MQWPIIPNKNLTSVFPLMFLSKHISFYALGSLKWILDIIWPLNQHFNLKNQRNWIKQVLMIKFWIGINCILLHRPEKLILCPVSLWKAKLLSEVCQIYLKVRKSRKDIVIPSISSINQGSKKDLILIPRHFIKLVIIKGNLKL